MISNNKNYFILILWIIFLGVLTGVVIFPCLRDIEKESQQIVFQKKILNFFENRIKDFQNVQEGYYLYQPVAEKIGVSFIDREVPIEFIEFLEKEAGDFGLTIDISPFNVPFDEKDLWLSAGFQVFLKGNFSDCLKFLERLEKSPWLVDILQLRVGEVKKELSFILTLKVFSDEPFLKENEDKK